MSVEGFPVHWVGTYAVVRLPDELDVSNARQLLEQLRLLLAEGATDLVADMSHTGFCDSSGVRVLLQGRGETAQQGRRFHVVASSVQVLRVFELLNVGALITIHPTVGAALAARSGAPGESTDPSAPGPSAGTSV